MAANKDQPIIYKKVKIPGAGGHGAAWKIAYADFVTAMMAFFLLLWLLNAAQKETLDGISNFFTPTLRTSSSPSGAGGLFGGVTANDPGPTQDQIQIRAEEKFSIGQGDLNLDTEFTGRKDIETTGAPRKVDYDSNNSNFNTLKELLEEGLNDLPPELQQLERTIVIDETEEGLRLQLLDDREHPLFERGTDILTPFGQDALVFIAQYIERLPNDLSITGHVAQDEADLIDLWPLSVDRAHQARRTLMENRIAESRFATIIGHATAKPLPGSTPTDAINQRITMVVLRKSLPTANPIDETTAPSLFNKAQ